MLTYLKLLFQLILSPANGWEDVARADRPAAALSASGFYPLTAVCSVSVFAKAVTHRGVGLPALLTDAIVTFVMFFLGYFIAVAALGMIPACRRATEQRRHTFAMLTLSLLELIAIVANLVPITMSIIWFLPAYAAIVMWKGTRYLDVAAADTGMFMLMAVPSVILPPYLISLILNALLP